jgi:hypothetical protein
MRAGRMPVATSSKDVHATLCAKGVLPLLLGPVVDCWQR